MSKVKVILPDYPVNGKQVSFVSPCSSRDTECLVIDNEDYAIVDADGVSVAKLDSIWNCGAIISVILNTETKTAYIQNANTNSYLEGRFGLHEYMYAHNDFFTPICSDDGPSFNIMDDDGNVVVADWQFEEKGNLIEQLTQTVLKLEHFVNTKMSSVIPYRGAGAHNAIYRGKCLGNQVTSAQYAAIKAGTFDDLYIGDYWIINGVTWRIAAFDYYLNCGDANCTTHHAVIVPDTCLYTAQMHNTASGGYEAGSANTTEGGYVGTDMHKTNLEQAKTIIKTAFPDHVLSHRVLLTNTVANGKPTNGSWYDSEVELMTEEMVYGTGIFRPTSDGSTVPYNYRVEKSQLPLFAHEPSRICNRQWYWLRDVVSATRFADVSAYGLAYYVNASHAHGVRPAFSIS